MEAQKTIGLGLVAMGAIAGGIFSTTQPVNALTLHDGWQYSIDAFNDSTPFKRNGSGLFEIYGTAHKIVGRTMVFAINSNVNLETGVAWNDAADKRVDFADLILNFTGQRLDEANGDLFGVRFARNNDSGVSELGLYKDVTAVAVASTNAGYASLGAYNKAVLAKGVTPQIGDLLYNDPYFNTKKQTITSIQSGTKIGEINLLDSGNSLLDDLDFAGLGMTGSNTIAFTFNAGLLPTGDALYHLALECNNDMVAAAYYNEVPTPAAILPSILGIFGIASRKKKDPETV